MASIGQSLGACEENLGGTLANRARLPRIFLFLPSEDGFG
jgi:hypothetical protein